MVCLYCSGKTQVVNSRHQKRLAQVWRRRSCIRCGAIFTTTEHIDLSSSLSVRYTQGHLRPFNRDKLYVSVLRACGHRKQGVQDAAALTATIIASICRESSGPVITTAQIITPALQALQRFDAAAGVHYRAYHQASATTS